MITNTFRIDDTSVIKTKTVVGLLKGIKNRFSSNTAEKLNIVLLIAIIVLSIGSAGFGKSSMILAIAIIYINNNHYYFREYSEGWKSLK